MAKKKNTKTSTGMPTPIKVVIDGKEYERFGNEKVTFENVAEASRNYSRLFGANKNLYRIAPSLQDGLKPGRRRLYWYWWENEGKPTNIKTETLNKIKTRKVGMLAAGTMGFYHPHGSTANEELIGREGQPWNNNVMSVIPEGSFGNLQASDPAAGRYIKAKMSPYMIDCFFDDFNKYCVPMKLSYEGERYEPEYLPAKYPHLLFNPQLSGIGYGMASNIPPFNVAEVLDATIKLMKNPSAKIMLIPDSPTGADIIDEGLFPEINKTGKSKFTLRASYEIDYTDNIIRFTSLPLQTKTKNVIDKVLAMRSNHQFEEILEIMDSTKNGDVDLAFRIRPDVNPDKVLAKLFKKNTTLKSTYSVAITVIDDYESFDYGVKDFLLAWIDSRRDQVRSMHLNALQLVMEKQHMNSVLCMVFNGKNIDKTIQISKTSKTRKETIERLMKEYGITSLQATTIADMHVYNFNEDSYNKYKQDAIDLKTELDSINKILSSDTEIDNFIINQLETGIKRYGRPRKSKIVKEDNKNESNIPDTDHLIGISESGYIKKLTITDNSSIGPVGKESGNLTVIQINNREDILVVDSTGKVSKISVSALPDMNFEDIGVEIGRYFSVSGKIIAIMKLPSMEALKTKDDNLSIIFITKMGLAKRVPLSEFKKITDCKQGINLNENDEVASALFAFDKTTKDIIICTNLGDGIRLPITDIKTAGRTAKGVQQINLKDGEYVVNACRINPKRKLLFYITSAGRVKLTETKYFPAMQRKDEALSLISLEGNETLVGVSSVSKDDIVMVYRKHSEPVQIKLSDITVSTRVAKGDKVVKTPKGDYVVAYKVFQ